MSEEKTKDGGTILRVTIDLALEPPGAFDLLVEELAAALARVGIGFAPGANGRLSQGEFEVGRVVSWEPGRRILLQWRQANWQPEEVTSVELRLEPVGGGTRVVLEHRDWGRLIGDPGELAGWFAGELAAPLLRAMAPAAFGDWLTDRWARRPSGPQSRAVYRDPVYHYPNFRVILAELALTPADYLVEVGCGGGALLKDALRSGCRAAAVDHSPDMVQLAREVNHEAVAEGRLEIRQAKADSLPFPDATFTCAAMTGVLGFLPDPVAALGEIRRVLVAGGRLVVLGSDPEERGTLAAPEPMASRLRFYDDDDLQRLAVEAGLAEVRVVRQDLEPFAREAGVPEEHVPLFAGPGARFLLARKG
ncbi:MAG: methyltransferase domain-containing protein [Chloroflexi bacterium]|nr:methyltransferase domain-containing protein [Chloroflexota bacterium]MCI0647337.1 methyltransferase domain-containing protein [Chloroflexota bacterium]MCI0727797.1 methyltransferase domain-containing protein [Chloroflexota bacterium]